MKFSLILENESGEQIDMTETANRYMTSEIDGLSPPAGTISTSVYAGVNGSHLNRAFIVKRNVVISFRMKGVNIEARRHALYRVVKPSHYIKVYYSTKQISVFTEGYVETCEVDNFTNKTSGQISIICPDPYWYALSDTVAEYAKTLSVFRFPFSIDDKGVPLSSYNSSNYVRLQNNGVETGITIRITGIGDTDKSTTGLTIYNADTGAYMRIQQKIQSGDEIVITTNRGHKTCNLIREGVQTNIINSLVVSDWLTAVSGENVFYIRAAAGINNIRILFQLTEAFSGV